MGEWSRPNTFDEVLKAEQRAIDAYRARRQKRRSGEDVAESGSKQLTGLAFSGGGIRSATFNLGVLQGLAKLGLLRRFDYLSTVSGGGYIGSWLVAWIHRKGLKAVEKGLSAEHPMLGQEATLNESQMLSTAEEQLRPLIGPQEASPISVLRQYSNYLTPKKGAFSLDAWMAGATYVRNLLLNLAIIVLALATTLLIPRLLVGTLVEVDLATSSLELQVIGVVMLMIAVFVIAVNLDIDILRVRWLSWTFHPTAILFAAATPIFLGGVAVALWIGAYVGARPTTDFAAAWRAVTPVRWALYSGIAYFTFWLVACAVWTVSFVATKKKIPKDRLVGVWGKWAGAVAHAFAAGAFGGLGLATVGAVMGLLGDRMGVAETAIWGAPALAMVFVTTGILHTGLMGRGFPEENRQWWSRLGGWIGIISLLWLVVFVSAFYAAPAFDWCLANFPRLLGSLSLGWAISTAAGVMAGRSAKTSGGDSSRWMELLAKVTPVVFIVGLLGFLSTGIQRVYPSTVEKISQLTGFEGGLGATSAPRWTEGASPANTPLLETLILLGLSVGLVLYLSWRVDINEFSMHLFYKNRLVRAYLGSSRWNKRTPMPFTGFDPKDDLSLGDLDPLRQTETGHDTYDGPLPLINTALNLTSGRELAWQERQAISFFFSPLHYGFERPSTERGVDVGGAYRPIKRADRFSELSLGTALAVSGAAVNPTMGYHSSKVLAFLLTVFNARLGVWLGNPARRSSAVWKKQGPRLGIGALMQELIGWTGARAKYVNLSDGGHFDNLGIYELVRRRCRFIVACDAEADPGLEFTGLGNAIRRCRADFGISIDIDVDPIRKDAETGSSRWHCAVGNINYDDRQPGATAGMLIYLKASTSGDEPADVLNYAEDHPEFPHESTGDQWFDESQFESYRMLGYHVCRELFDAIDLQPKGRLQWRGVSNERLFVELKQAWYPPSTAGKESFTQHAQQLDAIFERLRSDPELEFLDAQFYIELDKRRGSGVASAAEAPLPDLSDDRYRRGFYLCNSAIQLMESVYLDLDLEHEWGHPDNRGWRNLFRHWAGSSMFRQTWAISASTYGARFQRFCEQELSLLLGKVSVIVASEAEETAWLNPLEQRLLADMRRNQLRDSASRTLESRVDQVAIARLQVLDPRGGWAMRKQRQAGDGIAIDPGNVELEFTIGMAVLDESYTGADGYGLVYLRIRNHLRRLGLGRRALKCMLAPYGKAPTVAGLDLLSKNQAYALGLAEDVTGFRNMFQSAINEVAKS